MKNVISQGTVPPQKRRGPASGHSADGLRVRGMRQGAWQHVRTAHAQENAQSYQACTLRNLLACFILRGTLFLDKRYWKASYKVCWWAGDGSRNPLDARRTAPVDSVTLGEAHASPSETKWIEIGHRSSNESLLSEMMMIIVSKHWILYVFCFLKINKYPVTLGLEVELKVNPYIVRPTATPGVIG